MSRDSFQGSIPRPPSKDQTLTRLEPATQRAEGGYPTAELSPPLTLDVFRGNLGALFLAQSPGDATRGDETIHEAAECGGSRNLVMFISFSKFFRECSAQFGLRLVARMSDNPNFLVLGKRSIGSTDSFCRRFRHFDAKKSPRIVSKQYRIIVSVIFSIKLELLSYQLHPQPIVYDIQKLSYVVFLKIIPWETDCREKEGKNDKVKIYYQRGIC